MATEIARSNGRGLALIGIDPHAAGPEVQRFFDEARDLNIQLVEKATRVYAGDVREVFGDPENRGLRVEALRDLLLERGNVSVSRATLIARDQTLKTNAGLARARHEAAGVDSYRWSTSHDERVREMHADLEGEAFDYDDPPETNEDGDTNNPGEDYQCFPADSELQFADGVMKGFRRWYDGELALVVTDSGKTIRGTPNHPVLTRRGWVPLGALQLGDHVLEIAEEQPRARGLHEDDRVASVGDAFAAIAVCGARRTSRGSHVDFHGDGGEGDVDVVATDRPLVLGLLAGRSEGSEKLALAYADAAGLVRGVGLKLDFASTRAENRSMSASHDRGALLAGAAGEAERVRLAAVANAHAGMPQPRLEHDSLDAHAPRDRQQALAALVSLDDGRHVDVADVPGAPTGPLSVVGLHADSAEFLAQAVGAEAEGAGHFIQGLPGRQHFASVLRVDRLPFHGWVFNLETRTGWYATQGILAHNCRCVALPIIDELEEGDEPEDEEEGSEDEPSEGGAGDDDVFEPESEGEAAGEEEPEDDPGGGGDEPPEEPPGDDDPFEPEPEEEPAPRRPPGGASGSCQGWASTPSEGRRGPRSSRRRSRTSSGTRCTRR
jgi:SPP1 gp7 family putative phage head morphogenesis protein